MKYLKSNHLYKKVQTGRQLAPRVRNVTCTRLYFDGKNRRKCQMNNFFKGTFNCGKYSGGFLGQLCQNWPKEIERKDMVRIHNLQLCCGTSRLNKEYIQNENK